MNPPPPSSPRGDEPTPSLPLEDTLARALDLLESDGEPALEQFLAAHPDQAPQLREALADLRATDLLQAPRSEVPGQLGDFRLGAQLGAGGMGIVYTAEQVSLGRQVALKVVRPELLFFDGARERFRREIDAVARLEHPAIVPILATGTSDGIPYYAMPLLRGRSAEAVVKHLAARAARPATGAELRAALGEAPDAGASDADGTFQGPYWQAAVRLLRKAALGIQHAHARGVLHRDLKPSNLMFSADGRAVVLDFGLAQARGDAKLTRTGSQAGSPAYMAPEQVRGGPADERTDVYGLAATLHCLLGLQPPFPIGNPEVLRSRILAGQRHDLREAALPPELHLVLDTAMDVDRLRRYPSAEAFANDLQAVLEGRLIQARRLPFAVRTRRFAQRHRALSTAVVAVGVFLVVLPSALLWQQNRANAELAQQVARADRSATTSVDAVESLLANVAIDKLRNLPAVQTVAADLLDDAIGLFDRLVDDPTQRERVTHLRFRALDEAGRLAISLGGNAEASTFAQRQLDLLGPGELPPNARLQRASAQRLLAWVAYREGRPDEVPQRLVAARNDLAALAATEPATAAQRLLANVEELAGAVAEAGGDSIEAERSLRAAVAAAEAVAKSAGFDPTLGMTTTTLASLLLRKGNRQEARTLLVDLLAQLSAPGLREVGWPVPRLLKAMAIAALGSLHYDAKDQPQTQSTSREALGLLDDLVRDYPEEPTVLRLRGRTANLLAVSLHAEQNWSEARPLLEQACRDQLAVLGRNPKDRMAENLLSQHRRGLSVNLREQKDWKALAEVARALGTMPGGPEISGRAARDLLRCASEVDAAAAETMRQEALALLERAVAAGMKITPNDAVYAPVRDDPRFQALLAGSGGK